MNVCMLQLPFRPNDIILQTMKQANYSIDLTLKNLLDTASKDFAWEILQLQITLQSSPQPPLESLMRLIQLYMLGVEVLQNQDDARFAYFNNKIHSIMMRKSVVQQLHRIATGTTPDPQTLSKVHQMQMQNRRNEYEMQLTLQKDMYTLNNIKDIINKSEKHTIRKNQHVQNHLEGQNQVLEDRIKNRKLRSISKGKEMQHGKSPKIVSKASYGINPKIQQKTSKDKQ